MYKLFEPILILFLILFLSESLKDMGYLTRGFMALSKVVTNRWNLVVSSVLAIGLCPIKNKAALAAPVMCEIRDVTGMNNERAGWVSYFGSHLHYMASPLSASLALALSLSKVSFYDMLVWLALPIIFWLAATVKMVKFDSEPTANADDVKAREVVYLFPLVFVVFLLLVKFSFVQAVLLGIAVAYIMYLLETLAIQRLIDTGKIALDKVNWRLLMFITIITLTSYAVGKEYNLKEVFKYDLGLIPLYGFAIGLTIGSSAPAATLTFGMFSSAIVGNAHLAAMTYLGCFAGYMLSPLHNCLFVTAGLFKISRRRMYAVNLAMVAIIFAFALLAT